MEPDFSLVQAGPWKYCPTLNRTWPENGWRALMFHWLCPTFPHELWVLDKHFASVQVVWMFINGNCGPWTPPPIVRDDDAAQEKPEPQNEWETVFRRYSTPPSPFRSTLSIFPSVALLVSGLWLQQSTAEAVKSPFLVLIPALQH